MNLLDENIREDQRILLRKWRIPFRQIGKEIADNGTADQNLIRLLHNLDRATLFTQDRDFFKQSLSHKTYSLAYLDVRSKEVAHYVQRFLKHPNFCTQAKRAGRPPGIDVPCFP